MRAHQATCHLRANRAIMVREKTGNASQTGPPGHLPHAGPAGSGKNGDSVPCGPTRPPATCGPAGSGKNIMDRSLWWHPIQVPTQLLCPAIKRSRISRRYTVCPISPNALTASVSKAVANMEGSSPADLVVFSNYRR